MNTLRTPAVLAIVWAASPVWAGEVYVFTEDFEAADWLTAVDSPWTREGAPHAEIDVVQFSDGDARLGGASNGGSSGGVHFAYPPLREGGDHEEVFVDFHMPVRATEYYFEVTIDQLIYWEELAQPWGAGQLFYLGDAAEMDYGSQPQNGAPPTGPWLGETWVGSEAACEEDPDTPFPECENDTRIGLRQIWTGAVDPETGLAMCGSSDPADPDGVCGPCTDIFEEGPYKRYNDPICNGMYNGVWRTRVWTEHKDGSNTIAVTDSDGDKMGEVVFRMTTRNKDDHSLGMSHALDNITITLTSVCSDPFADADDDGDVDHDDFGAWQRCYTGEGDPGGVFDSESCLCFDWDADQDVDVEDFAAWQACASGPSIPADETCDDL